MTRLPLNAMRNGGPHFSINMGYTALQRAWFSSMKALLTDGQLFRTGHGHYEVVKQSGNGFLYEVDGA